MTNFCFPIYFFLLGRTDGRMVGRSDGRTDSRTDGLTVGRTARQPERRKSASDGLGLGTSQEFLRRSCGAFGGSWGGLGCLWRVLWLPWGGAPNGHLLEGIYPLRLEVLMKGFFITLGFPRRGPWGHQRERRGATWSDVEYAEVVQP